MKKILFLIAIVIYISANCQILTEYKPKEEPYGLIKIDDSSYISIYTDEMQQPSPLNVSITQKIDRIFFSISDTTYQIVIYAYLYDMEQTPVPTQIASYVRGKGYNHLSFDFPHGDYSYVSKGDIDIQVDTVKKIIYIFIQTTKE